jgi:hypothetical protein
MSYRTIQPPFTLKFRQMSKKELKEYFQWFQDVMPERLEELRKAVHTSPGFSGWRADYLPDSLDSLGDWFAVQVETRKRTEEELEEKRQDVAHAAHPVEIPDWELTNRTFSLAMDIARKMRRMHEK